MKRKLASGEVSEADFNRPWTLTSPPGISPGLLAFIQSGDFTKLAEALKASPGLVWHPLVHRTMKHLRAVYRRWWYEDERVAVQAHRILRTLIEAAAQGLLLGGAWSLESKRGPGRPRKSEDNFLFGHELLSVADELKELFDEERQARRKKGDETNDEREARVAGLVEQAWRQSTLASEADLVASEPSDPRSPAATLNDLLDEPMNVNVRDVPPPPREQILEWMRDAYEKSEAEGRPVSSQLIWKMLGRRYALTENQVRYHLDTAQAEVKASIEAWRKAKEEKATEKTPPK